jgi:CheY-like chemotaxis protein
MPRIGTILLVEDKADDALLVGLGLRIAGIKDRLEVVNNEKDFTNYARGEAPYNNRREYPIPRLILLDLQMPSIDAIAVMTWLRHQPGFQRLPVVALTNSPYARKVTRAYQAGANSFLTKPADLTQFVAKIKQMADYWLGGEQIGARTGRAPRRPAR